MPSPQQVPAPTGALLMLQWRLSCATPPPMLMEMAQPQPHLSLCILMRNSYDYLAIFQSFGASLPSTSCKFPSPLCPCGLAILIILKDLGSIWYQYAPFLTPLCLKGLPKGTKSKNLESIATHSGLQLYCWEKY